MKPIETCGCLMLAWLLLAAGCYTPAEGNRSDSDIVWRGTRAYDRLVNSLPIQPTEAFRLAMQAAQKSRGLIASSRPEFLVGKWYRFGDEEKAEIPLTGYYVNGESGVVELRKSASAVKHGRKTLPKEAWLTE